MATSTTYQGKPVTIIRPARKGDDGFNDTKDQVLVKLDDGTSRVILRAEVKTTTS